MRNGRLSETQVKEIAGAAIVQPEPSRTGGRGQQAAPEHPQAPLPSGKGGGIDQSQAYEKIRGRYLHNWTDEEGAVRFDARLTPDEGARLVMAVKAETVDWPPMPARQGATSRRERWPLMPWSGWRAAGDPENGSGISSSGPATMVHVRVDHEALMRGHLEAGRSARFPAFGPIPVDVARRLAADSILSVLITDGVDVTSVAHGGRTIPGPSALPSSNGIPSA